MQIDVNLRARAARTLLDVVSVMELDADDNEEAALQALGSLGVDIENDPHVAAALSAATDLLWYMFHREAVQSGSERTVIVSNAREHLLPLIYPDATQ